MFRGKICLITGGTGSWGNELTRRLLEQHPKEIRIFSRNEFAQVSMQRAFHHHPSLKFIVGDVRDYEAVRDACKGVDYVFHLAALKHVPVCEQQPIEALKSNVTGTLNVIRASIEEHVEKVVDVSTDKAVDPVNFYGITKSMGEKLMIHANELSDTTRFVCIRGGNVLGTNGSVVPLFQKQIADSNEVTLTSCEMTRFFLTISEAIALLLRATEVSVGGETFVMRMRMCKICDLAEVLGKRMSTTPINIHEIGIRPGEKLHEVLVSASEASNTYQYDEQYFVILPNRSSKRLLKAYKNFPKVNFNRYESSQNLMGLDEIEDILERGGFLG